MGKVKENAKRVAILMAVAGFIFSTVAITVLYFFDPNNQSSQEKQQAELLKQLQEQNQTKKLPLEGYKAEPFDADSVKKLKVETLKKGDGPTAKASSTVSANYFGWTSDGKIFDSTNKGAKATPIDFPLDGVIKGWTKGLTGVKEGSTVKLLIPADMAYGSTDTGDGRPVGPLAFIIEVKEVK